MNTLSENSKNLYWEDFYGKKNVTLALPSQFAAFAINEAANVDGVIEIGCGSGRDALFFATYGYDVLAMDTSTEAINLCRSVCRTPNAIFEVSLSFKTASEQAAAFAGLRKQVLLYARFFLHAISDDDENSFFELARATLSPGSMIALEYRTKEDTGNEKEFGIHYRRFIEHKSILEKLKYFGFCIIYETQGKGFAKYKKEDAAVGRCIAVRTKNL